MSFSLFMFCFKPGAEKFPPFSTPEKPVRSCRRDRKVLIALNATLILASAGQAPREARFFPSEFAGDETPPISPYKNGLNLNG